ncbi:MAG: hypothetical protein CTY15_00945 [Methylocystis sp.]|nr:MAG: hypothetical protein CTY15_00945 [Methylocystis sp.]
MTKFPVAAGIALALVAGSALAADLPTRKAPPAYIPPPPVFSWTGLYGGVNVGYGFGDGTISNGGWAYISPAVGGGLPAGGLWNVPNNLNGVTGGGQIGYNYQFSPWFVIGLEADVQAADIRSGGTGAVGAALSAVPFGPHFASVNASHRVDWWGTVRGRVGVTMPSWPNLMVYGTGGFAYGAVNRTVSMVDVFTAGGAVSGGGIFDNTQTGWTAGGGVEYTPMAFPSWSLKVEYLYTDLGSSRVPFLGVFTAPVNGPNFAAEDVVSTRFHTVRAGVNWHFNPFAPSAPVLAKY